MCVEESLEHRKGHLGAFNCPGACALGVLALPTGVAGAHLVSPTAKSVGQSRKAAGYNIMYFLSAVILHFLMVSRPLCSAHGQGTNTAVGTPGTVQAVEGRPGGGNLANPGSEIHQGYPSNERAPPLSGLTHFHFKSSECHSEKLKNPN